MSRLRRIGIAATLTLIVMTGTAVEHSRTAGPVVVEANSQIARTPGPVAQDSSVDVVSLLKSGDARQQAWGAWYAGAGQLRHLSPLLLDVVQQRLSSQWPAVVALDVALDALIQMRVPLPPGLLADVYAVRPAPALIAASFKTADSEDFLLNIVRLGRSLDWFAAANLLTLERSRRLAPELLASMELRVRVFLVDQGHMMGGGSGGGVGMGCGGVGLAPGMPPWPFYTLTPFAEAGVTVLAMGPRPV
jgi:hypothetical protein